MNIHSLTIENLRGFAGKHEVVFRDKNVAAFIGVNGAGKSTVLEAIVTSLTVLIKFAHSFTFRQPSLISRLDINKGKSEARWAIELIGPDDKNTKYHISSNYSNKPEDINSIVSGYGKNESEFIDWLNVAVFELQQHVPIIAYYRGQTLGSNEIGLYSSGEGFADRRQAYAGAIDVAVDFAGITKFYNQVVNVQNAEAIRSQNINYRSPAVNAYEKGISNFLSTLEGGDAAGKIELTYQGNQEAIIYRKGDTVLLMDQLSAGEKSVIALAMDIIYRCVVANGHLPTPLHSPGVVVIDEIELHLHPRWQANIIKALTTTFPNIQFIVSTHSPLVINQLQDEQVFALRKKSIVPGTELQKTYGMDAGTVISKIMGAPSRPPEITERFDEVATLLGDPTPENLQRVKDRLAALRDIISPNDLELIQLSNILSIEESATDL